MLIVEDEKGLAESMRRGLVGEGFVVDVVHDGVSGLWAASEFSYDVAILDIMLPGHERLRVLEEIAGAEDLDSGAHAHRKGRRVRPDRCFRPRRGRLPDQAVQLHGLGRAATGTDPPRRPGASGDAHRWLTGPGPGSAHGHPRGELIKLTAREFGLLTYLMRNAGSVVARPTS